MPAMTTLKRGPQMMTLRAGAANSEVLTPAEGN